MERDYETLGIPSDATPEQVRQAYRDMANVWHPDRFSHDERLQAKAQEQLKEINAAYERLTRLTENSAAQPLVPQAGATPAPRSTTELTPRITTFSPRQSMSLLLRLLMAALLVGVLLALNSWVERPVLDQSITSFYGMNRYIEDIIVFCGINIILAVALNIVNGFTGQFSLGHVGFFAVGAYVAGALSTYGHNRLFPMLPLDGHPLGVWQSAYPLLVLCLAGGLAAAAIGYIVGLPSLRLRGDYLAILTLGFAQIIQTVILNTKAVYGETTFNGIPRGSSILFIPHLASFFWVYMFVAVTIWVAYGLRFSTHGLAFLAVREDEIAAEAMGIDTTKFKVIAFVLSAFFTGIAGALFAVFETSLSSSQFSFMRGIDIVIMVVLGGLGSISGVALAAVLLTLLPEALRALPDGEQYRLVIYPLLLVILMLTRPQGIFGREEISWAWARDQWSALRGLGHRRAPDGPEVMLTSRDREPTETETGED